MVEQMGTHFLYFAYGSNMLTERLRARCLSARQVDVGYMQNHALNFSKISNDKSGKATPIPKDGSKLYGVLFNIDTGELEKLDRAEGAGNGYKRVSESVQIGSQEARAEAVTYVATKMDANLKPYDWYRNLVLAGAIQHGLPEQHQDFIRSFEVVIDADKGRRSRLSAIEVLKQAGFQDIT